MEEKKKVNIGLDIGVTSVGWAIVNDDSLFRYLVKFLCSKPYKFLFMNLNFETENFPKHSFILQKAQN